MPVVARSSFELPAGTLTFAARGPKWRSIYRALRSAILGGHLAPGSRVPATRTLAHQLGVARNSVLAAFDQLTAEGFIESRRGAGSFVAARLPSHPLRPTVRKSSPPRISPRPAHVRRVLASAPDVNWRGDVRPFAPGIPALNFFPVDLWARLSRRYWREATLRDLSYGPPGGLKGLREVIAQHLRTTRAVRCDWEQVFVVPGVHHALSLAASVLLTRDDRVWMEDPGYAGAWNALTLSGAKLVGVPVDDEGLDVSAGRRKAPDARAVYVTPSHQYPLGTTMTLARRLELLGSAVTDNRWVIEDDYDSEFRYTGPPLAALQGIDRSDRVLYVGTFSKVLAPGLRIAYLVSPPPIVDAIAALHARDDRLTPTVDQQVLTAFFAEGHFGRHVHRMRQIYQERSEALVEALEAELAGAVTVRSPEAGLHVVAWLSRARSDRAVSARAKKLGIDVRPLQDFARQVQIAPGLVLGSAAYSTRQIRQSVRRLARAFDR